MSYPSEFAHKVRRYIKGRELAKIQEFLYQQGILSYDKTTNTYIRNVMGNRMHLHKYDLGISLDLAQWGIRESIPTMMLQSLIDPSMVCCDIGANIGYYALLEASVVARGTGTVIAIEPEPNNYNMLRLNIESNHFDNYVKAHQCAISDSTGDAELVVTPTSNACHLVAIKVGTKNTTIRVPCYTLPDFMKQHKYEKIDFLRMDIEGGEYLLFPTIYKLLEDQVSLIFMEFHPTVNLEKHIECVKELAKLGFKAQNIVKYYFRGNRETQMAYCHSATIEDLWQSEFLLRLGAMHVIFRR